MQLLGGLTPTRFMSEHWQKKPLLVRQAVPGFAGLVDRAGFFELVTREDATPRLLAGAGKKWVRRDGPFTEALGELLPAKKWTLLAYGIEGIVPGGWELLCQFDFIPRARIDDLMVSWAVDGGSVGPHDDDYDVFLLQGHGRRRWRIARRYDPTPIAGAPIKVLRPFEPEQEWVLEPGDMLYLPPRYAHDGVAEGADCMTYSIGLRSPAKRPLGADLLARVAEAHAEELEHASPASSTHTHYRDPKQEAVDAPAAMPEALQAFAREAVALALREPDAIERALGESMTEPKANVWFDEGDPPDAPWQGVSLDRRTRMLYDARHVFINGEAFAASGRDARLMRRLANERRLDRDDVGALSGPARELLGEWAASGWLHAC